MACQASARVARGWIVLSGRPPSGGLRLMIRGRGKVLYFLTCLCFIFLAITAIGCMGVLWKYPMFTTVFFTNTLPSEHGTERGARRHNRGSFRAGLAAAGLSPFLFLSAGWTAGGVVFAGVWVRRHPGVTRSSCRAGALRQEVSHCLGRLLCSCELFSKALYCRTKQAGGGDRGVKEGDLIRILHLRQVQPQMALKHH